MSQQKNVKKLLEKLKMFGKRSESEPNICDVLIKLRPYSKKASGIKSILENNGVEVLLQYLKGPNRRILDMSISVLANCLTEDAFQQKVFDCQGIPHIVRILQCVKSFSILSRTCRCIANLAAHHESANIIHAIGTVELIVELTRNPSATTDCIFSALRAFKNLGNTPAHRKKLVQQGVVSAIARLIPFKTKDIAIAAVRALSAISRSCTIEFADHMLSNDGIAISELVKIANEDADRSSVIKQHALNVLQNLTLQACTRPTLGSFNGINLFVAEVRNVVDVIPHSGTQQQYVEGPLPENAFLIVSSLCYCCREAINRARLRSLDALPIFVHVLKDPRWQPVHLFILGSLQCFIYDEEGLKILHESGIFSVMLQKLEEYCQPEFENRDDNGDLIRDGHDIDEKERFDRRQSLSYDIPTKFNDRPQSKNILSNDIYQPGVSWSSTEDIPAYSPQWSPINRSSVLNELATFTPPSSPKDLSNVTYTSHSPKQQEDTNQTSPETEIYFDESSSSRDGFDLLQSPTLLPMTHTLQYDDGDTEPRGYSRTKGDNAGSESNIQYEKPENSASGIITQVIKKAKLNSGAQTTQSSDDVGDKVEMIDKGFCSPSRDSILHEAVVRRCSPSFLKFVKETYSPSSLMERTTSILKQPKRKFSSPNKISEAIDVIQGKGPSNQSQVLTSSLDTLTSMTAVDDSDEQQCPTDSMDDTVPFSIYEEPTPNTVVLGLLCHYCEVSDSYVSSLCQEDNCAQSITTHLHCCNSLDLKIQRIIDKLTSCSKCFGHVISSHFIPMLASVCTTRMRCTSCVSCKITPHCKILSQTDWFNLLDNVWHNVTLIQSSFYGSNLITSYLNKWTVETKSTTITLLLLTLWYEETGKLCNVAEELRRKLHSNLQMIAEEGFILKLLQSMPDEEGVKNSKIFEGICLLFHKLASRVEPSKSKKTVKSDRKEGGLAESTNSSVGSNELLCLYEQACQSQEPDKELRIYCDKPMLAEEGELQTKEQDTFGPSDETVIIPVHSDVLISGSLMFKTMLTGSYRESSEKTVTLMDTSYAATTFILHLLYGCNITKCLHTKAIYQLISDSTCISEPVIANSSVKQNIELEILKTMDLWIVQGKKDDYIRDFIEIFIEKYVRPEVKQYRKECDGKKTSGHGANSEATLSTCFWDFICMHKYHSITESYIEEFCSPCWSQHNHVKHGEAFVSLCNQFQECSLFCEAIFGKFNQIVKDVLLPKLDTWED